MDDEMTLGQWILTLVLTCIPCVNIVMLLIWAFGSGQYISRKRWAQAQLIICAVVVVLYFIMAAIFGAAIAGFVGTLS